MGGVMMRKFLFVLLCAVLICPFCILFAAGGESEIVPFEGKLLKPIDIRALKIAKPREIAVLNPAQTKNYVPRALCWSPDDSSLFIFAVPPLYSNFEASFPESETPGHPLRLDPRGNPFRSPGIGKDGVVFCLSSATGKDFRTEKEVPAWMGQYWDRKASRISPDGTSIENRKTYPIAWFDTSGIGYSWSPPGGMAIVFVQGGNGKMYVMSEDGREKRKIAGAGYTLPAWSNDGKKIAFLWCTDSMQRRFHLEESRLETWRSGDVYCYVYVVDLSGIGYQEAGRP
jgi:hypothetical protein